MLSAEVGSEGIYARLGVTVSRRVGNAVVRNRVKRRIREWYRQVGRQQVVGRDIVVIARPGAAGLDTARSFAELSELAGGRGTH